MFIEHQSCLHSWGGFVRTNRDPVYMYSKNMYLNLSRKFGSLSACTHRVLAESKQCVSACLERNLPELYSCAAILNVNESSESTISSGTILNINWNAQIVDMKLNDVIHRQACNHFKCSWPQFQVKSSLNHFSFPPSGGSSAKTVHKHECIFNTQLSLCI